MSEPILSLQVLRDLLVRICQGDQEAATDLVDAYTPLVRSVALHRLSRHVHKRCDADDVNQMVWADFFTNVVHRHSFDSAESFEAYLCGMCANKVLEIHRNNFDTQSCALGREEPMPAELRQPGPTGQEMIDVRDEWEHDHGRLPPEALLKFAVS